MRTDAQTARDRAEQRAVSELIANGWSILGSHVHVGRAELDLVAVDPGPPRSLVVVEVRFRRRRDFGLPEESVDHRKLARLKAAAFGLRALGRLRGGTPLPSLPIRLDLIVVEPAKPLHRHVG